MIVSVELKKVYGVDKKFDDGEFFVADLDDGGVRIGMVGSNSFDIPAGHAWHERVREANFRAYVEALFDELQMAFA